MKTASQEYSGVICSHPSAPVSANQASSNSGQELYNK